MSKEGIGAIKKEVETLIFSFNDHLHEMASESIQHEQMSESYSHSYVAADFADDIRDFLSKIGDIVGRQELSEVLKEPPTMEELWKQICQEAYFGLEGWEGIEVIVRNTSFNKINDCSYKGYVVHHVVKHLHTGKFYMITVNQHSEEVEPYRELVGEITEEVANAWKVIGT